MLAYLNVSKAAFKNAGGVILFFVSAELLAAKRHARKRSQSMGDTSRNEVDSDNLAI